MPETSIVLSGDAIGPVLVMAFVLLAALYFVVKRAVITGLRSARSEQSQQQVAPSVDHYAG